jgi:hypothetical protein
MMCTFLIRLTAEFTRSGRLHLVQDWHLSIAATALARLRFASAAMKGEGSSKLLSLLRLYAREKRITIPMERR